MSAPLNTPGASALYWGQVMHRRWGQVKHRFVYKLAMFLLDLEDVPRLGRALRLFAHNKPAVFSFYDRDHGPGVDAPLRLWLADLLNLSGVTAPLGRVRLLCLPRLFGYVFNPISVFYCDDEDGQSLALVYEVTNTFGERHHYVHGLSGSNCTDAYGRHGADKAFYVSPFIGPEGDYSFRLTPPAEQLEVGITMRESGEKRLTAALRLQRRDLTDRKLAVTLLAYPLVTLKVWLAIHWQAMRLWIKGARLFRHQIAYHGGVSQTVSR